MVTRFDEPSKTMANPVSRQEALRKPGLTLAALVVLAALTICRASAQSYTITGLPRPPYTPTSINASGRVCTGGDSPAADAYLWSPTTPNGLTGVLTSLPPLPTSEKNTYPYSNAAAINASGVTVGWTLFDTVHFDKKIPYTYSTYSYSATLWQNGTATPLSAKNGAASFAYGINDSGDVVGVVNSLATFWHNGSPTTLATPAGSSSDADAINAIGQIVGMAGGGATLWQGGKAYSMGTLPGAGFSRALSINRFGQAVGVAYFTDQYGNAFTHAFLWTPATPNGTSGSMVDPGILPGYESSFATGINASGQVVGYCHSDNNSDTPFIWDSVRGMRDLNTLLPAGSGWVLSRALAINDFGQIVGTGRNGDVGAFLMTPQ
jgi:probable HAF family extracellular repeat protein